MDSQLDMHLHVGHKSQTCFPREYLEKLENISKSATKKLQKVHATVISKPDCCNSGFLWFNSISYKLMSKLQRIQNTAAREEIFLM